MLRFSHQFPIAWKKAGKSTEWKKPGKLVHGKILQNPSYVEKLGKWDLQFSHSMGAFLPLDSHPIVYFIICEIHEFPHHHKIHQIGRAWEIGTIFFLKVWVLFFHQIPILFIYLFIYLFILSL